MCEANKNAAVDFISCESNFAYVLQENDSFLPTEYKVLQSQENGCFVRCMKLLYNGKIQVYYLTDGYQPLSELISSLSEENFLRISSGLLSSAIRIQKNGFLSLQNVDLSVERIYIIRETSEVRLVYLPIKEGFFPDRASFERQLRTRLHQMISAHPDWDSEETRRLISDLTDEQVSLQKLAGDIQAEILDESQTKRMQLIGVHTPEEVTFSIDKEEFILGRSAAAADGVISFNKMISRAHCKIVGRDGQYRLEDLGSANGTYVNQTRVLSGQTVLLQDGDMVRLADSEFRVSIK